MPLSDLTIEDSGLYECVASSRSGKYVWQASLTVDSFSPSHVGAAANFLPNGLLDSRPNPPMKPQVVEIDATTITIAWDPKYFNLLKSELAFQQGKRKMAKSFDSANNYDEDDWEPRFKRNIKNNNHDDSYYYLSDEETPRKIVPDEIYQQEKHHFDQIVREIARKEILDEDKNYYYDSDDNEEEDISDRFVDTKKSDNNLIIKSENNTVATTSTPLMIPTTISTSTTTTMKTSTTQKMLKKAALTYRVEYYSGNEKRSEWLLGGADIMIPIFTVHYLKPSTEYVFIVRAVSPEGILSPPSEMSERVSTNAPNGRNSDVQKAREMLNAEIVLILQKAYATSSTSVKLEWKVSSLKWDSLALIISCRREF